MLTEEQIKNLKKGDPVIIHGTFEALDADGDICIKSPMTFCGRLYNDNLKYAHPSVVSIVEPKHDPTRLFKEGDIVKRRTVDGRTDPDVAEGIDLTVKTSEGKYGNVIVQDPHGRRIATKSVFLELITPVEELEPYYIVENDIEFQVRMKYEDKDCLISVFRFKNIVEGYKQYYDMLPTMKQAREAAEDECKRLNEEYRKEQETE